VLRDCPVSAFESNECRNTDALEVTGCFYGALADEPEGLDVATGTTRAADNTAKSPMVQTYGLVKRC
jgi:hypothetical protein